MYFADSDNGRVSIDLALCQPDREYRCPCCGGLLRIRNGSVKAAHFAHVSKVDCDDFSHDMSEWHFNWQSMFPEKCREVVIERVSENGVVEKHRADVCACDIVIEFQHSPISQDEFWRRNDFYTSAGYQLLWVFDYIDVYDGGRGDMQCYAEWWGKKDNGGKFRWSYHKKFLDGFEPQEEKNITLFFQLADISDVEDDESIMERVIWAAPDDLGQKNRGFSRFFTSYYPGTVDELKGWLRKGIIKRRRAKQKIPPREIAGK